MTITPTGRFSTGPRKFGFPGPGEIYLRDRATGEDKHIGQVVHISLEMDMSAIERRVLAHPELFGTILVDEHPPVVVAPPGFDPYRERAAQLFGVPIDEITAEQRQAAKREMYRRLYSSPVTLDVPIPQLPAMPLPADLENYRALYDDPIYQPTFRGYQAFLQSYCATRKIYHLRARPLTLRLGCNLPGH